MYDFHLYIVVVIKMVEPQDDYDQNVAMMNIINAGTQYGPNNQNEVDLKFDNGSQYLLNFEDEQEPLVQENAGEVYLLIILHLLYIYEIMHNSINSYIYICITESLCFYVCSPLDR
jgi:hypothetical protein